MRAALYEVPVKSPAFGEQLAAGLLAGLDCLAVEVVEIDPCAAGLSAAESREAAGLVLAGFVATVRSWHHVEPHEGYADVARRGLRLVELPVHLRLQNRGPFCACGRVVSECDGSRTGCANRGAA